MTDRAATLERWIEHEFTGHGIAIRRKDDPPIPGEPFMSMDVAKDLVRRAVAAFGEQATIKRETE